MTKEQAALDENGRDSECSGQSEEEAEEEDALKVFTSDDCRHFAEKYLNIQQKVTSPSGKMLKDILFQVGQTRKHHHLIHSFIIDENDEIVRSLFEPVDWTFIMKEKPKDIILDDLDVTNILERFRGTASTAGIMKDWKDRPMRLGATYVFSRDLS
ncbi:hypothetical protein BGZ59_002627 [Podila verticillata]|nr:hypothetical protein BGZ59_002627 [Podila verticillata]KFH73941.1 hypothetical protein MVEG_01154 [Podila verticillata NRRL 6337]